MKERLSPEPCDGQSVSSGSDVSAASGQLDQQQQQDDENRDRGNWAGRLDFLLSLVGSVLATLRVFRDGRRPRYAACDLEL